MAELFKKSTEDQLAAKRAQLKEIQAQLDQLNAEPPTADLQAEEARAVQVLARRMALERVYAALETEIAQLEAQAAEERAQAEAEQRRKLEEAMQAAHRQARRLVDELLLAVEDYRARRLALGAGDDWSKLHHELSAIQQRDRLAQMFAEVNQRENERDRQRAARLRRKGLPTVSHPAAPAHEGERVVFLDD